MLKLLDLNLNEVFNFTSEPTNSIRIAQYKITDIETSMKLTKTVNPNISRLIIGSHGLTVPRDDLISYHADAVARLESLRALELSRLKRFRVLKLTPRLESFRAL